MSMTTKRTAVLLVFGLAALGAGPPVRQTASASPDAKMFPDGRHYDFGKAKVGTMFRHTFRVVNTGDGPLEIVNVRVGMGPVTARMHKRLLKPSETDELVVEINTSRFADKKMFRLFLTTKRGEVTQEFAVTITGISDRSP